jgi:hypothetical protein
MYTRCGLSVSMKSLRSTDTTMLQGGQRAPVHNETNWNGTNSGHMVLAVCNFENSYFVLTTTAINSACIDGNCFWCYGGEEQYTVVASEM